MIIINHKYFLYGTLIFNYLKNNIKYITNTDIILTNKTIVYSATLYIIYKIVFEFFFLHKKLISSYVFILYIIQYNNELLRFL